MSVCCRQTGSCTDMRGEVESVGYRRDLKQVRVTGGGLQRLVMASSPAAATIALNLVGR